MLQSFIMRVQALSTPTIHTGDTFWSILSDALPALPEKSVLVVTSKVLSLCEGNVRSLAEWEKHALVAEEAEWYTDPHSSKYDLMLTIKHNQLCVNAGIDESNADGQYVLWPQDPQRWANEIWLWLRQEFGVQEVGVLITDSKTTPFHWGVTGTALAHCGFSALASKIDRSDLFGRPLKMTQVNVAQALAAVGVFEMGEADESTPLALVEDIRDITFQLQPPSEEELRHLTIDIKDDVYAPVLLSADWKKGGSYRS